MNITRLAVFATVLIATAACLQTDIAVGAGNAGSNPVLKVKPHKTLPWKELYFQGGKGFSRITASVRLRPSREFCPKSIKNAVSDFMPCPLPGRDLGIISVETAVSTLIPPQSEYSQHVWFNTKTGSALQRIRLKNGTHPWLKAYRWQEDGVSRLKIRPDKPEEFSLPPDKWNKRHASFFKYPQKEVKACPVISESTVLLHLLSMIDVGKTRFPFQLCVFGKKRLHRVTVHLAKLKPLKIAFESYGLQGERRIEKTIKPLVFLITSASMDKKGEKDEAFSLLGLQDDIYIFLDPGTRLPVRLIGQTKRFGEMIIALTGAWIN